MAASATFALQAGEWFRRGRLFMLSPDSRAQRARCQAETPLIVLSRFPRPALRAFTTASRPGLSPSYGFSISHTGLPQAIRCAGPEIGPFRPNSQTLA